MEEAKRQFQQELIEALDRDKKSKMVERKRARKEWLSEGKCRLKTERIWFLAWLRKGRQLSFLRQCVDGMSKSLKFLCLCLILGLLWNMFVFGFIHYHQRIRVGPVDMPQYQEMPEVGLWYTKQAV